MLVHCPSDVTSDPFVPKILAYYLSIPKLSFARTAFGEQSVALFHPLDTGYRS